MEPKVIELLVGGLAMFGLLMWGAVRMRGRAVRKYRAKFAALGPGQETEIPQGLRYACTYQDRAWRLEMLAPIVFKATANLARDEVPRFVAQVRLALPAPLGLYVLIGPGFLGARASKRFDQQAVSIAQASSSFVGATDDVRGLFTAELQAMLVRIYRLPMIDLELVIEPGGRTLTCTKLYGAHELAALLTALGELVDVLERAWSGDPYRTAPRPAGGQPRASA